jgi:hypothetical protein
VRIQRLDKQTLTRIYLTADPKNGILIEDLLWHKIARRLVEYRELAYVREPVEWLRVRIGESDETGIQILKGFSLLFRLRANL